MNTKLIVSTLLLSVALLFSCSEKQPKVEYAGQDLAPVAKIIRDKETKKATLSMDLDETWKLYVGNSVETIDTSKPFLEGKGRGEFPLDLDPGTRYYFLLVAQSGQSILSDKLLPMAGGFNFRDMGGIRTQDGKYVKWGKVFRTDDLHNLTDADLQYLAGIPIVTVVDFRAESEIAEAPDKLPSSVKNDMQLCINPGSLNSTTLDKLEAHLAELGGPEEMMKDLNRSLSKDSLYRDQYRKYFAALQNDDEVPLMFHCSAGKDRTGMGAALFLASLGVSNKVIFEDYLQSNVYLADKYADVSAKYPGLEPLFSVKKEYLQAGFTQIEEDYGSIENFLRDELHVDLEKMKEKYLY